MLVSVSVHGSVEIEYRKLIEIRFCLVNWMGSWLSPSLQTDDDTIGIDFVLNNVNMMKQITDKNKAGMTLNEFPILKEWPGASHFLCHSWFSPHFCNLTGWLVIWWLLSGPFWVYNHTHLTSSASFQMKSFIIWGLAKRKALYAVGVHNLLYEKKPQLEALLRLMCYEGWEFWLIEFSC